MNIISNAGAVSAGTGSGSGGGGGSSLDSQTVTVGATTAGTTSRRGFSSSGSYGSISDGTSNLYSGAAIVQIQYTWDTSYPISGVALTIDGASRANSGWTTLTIGTTSYQRSSAQYAPDAGGDTYWTWFAGTDNTGAGNPFSGTGTTTTCVFT
tara:strand:- start:1479 stop:1937 length:459 start_codon:yes stop_codon:yes gene_type:complete